MNRVANTYSLNNRLAAQQVAPRATPVFAPSRQEVRERIRLRAEHSRASFVPRWLFFIAVVALTVAFCATLSARTQTEMSQELHEQQLLHREIEQLQNDNSAIRDEVRRLQYDSATIERAARERLKMVGKNERIIVPGR